MITLDFLRARKATHYSRYEGKRAAFYELLTRFINACHKGKEMAYITLKTPSAKMGRKLERVIKRHRPEAKVHIIHHKVEFNVSPNVRIKYITSLINDYTFDSVEHYLDELKHNLLEQITAEQVDVLVICAGNANVGIAVLQNILKYHPFTFIFKLIPCSIMVHDEFVIIDDNIIDYDVKWDYVPRPTIQAAV